MVVQLLGICAIMAGMVALEEPVVYDSGRLVVNVYFVRKNIPWDLDSSGFVIGHAINTTKESIL